MLDTISTGAAGSWQMSNNGYKILEDNFDPGFFVYHYIKDMRIAMEEASERDTALPVLADVLGMFEKLDAEGGSKLGTQALIKIYDAGLDYSNVLQVICYLKDMADFQAFNEVYGTYFTDQPARVCVAVSGMTKGASVEVSLVAARD